MRCVSTGPTTAQIAIIGEAPDGEAEEKGYAFAGSLGWLLDSMLKDAKITREQCYVTNVCMDKPPGNKLENWIPKKTGMPRIPGPDGKKIQDPSFVKFRGKWVKTWIKEDCERLYAELRALKPNVVLALGNIAMWALCSQPAKVATWRASTLESDVIPGLKVIPTFHPTAIQRQADWRFITVQDFRRAKRESASALITKADYRFITNPDFSVVVDTLFDLKQKADKGNFVRLVCDLEIKRKQIVCLGLAWSKREALCIPFYHIDGKGEHRWTPEEHVVIINLLSTLLCHPKVLLCNQNISFDIQYLFWRFNIWPNAYFDTMIAQNVLFAGAPKKLHQLAALYCEHYVYWKDDGKFWDKPIIYQQLWHYNCLDCVYTFEVWEEQEKALIAAKLTEQYDFEQKRLFKPVMKMMLRGIKVNDDKKRPLLKELKSFTAQLAAEAEFLAGVPLLGEKGGFSSQKLFYLFYERLKLPKQFNRKGGENIVTCDDEALKKLARKEPLIRPLTERISMARSYATAVTACSSGVDSDGRWRTAYNIAGTNTYRFSSSENPLGSGLNLQNLTVGKDMTL